MFLLEAPKTQTLEMFSAMPNQFRKPKRTAWADANQGGREIDAFLEGPVFDRNGNLFVTDIAYGRVFRIDSKGNWDLIVQWEGEPNGMKFISDHELLITDYLNGLMLLDLTTATLRPFLARRNSESFRGLNDLFVDTQRNVYFTDQGQTGLHDPTGRVYRLAPDGRLDLLLSNCPSPNGLVLSHDEKFLFVAMTRGNCVWRMPLQRDGSVSKVGQFFTSYGPSGPDGLAMSRHGLLLVANPGLGYVWALNAQAEPHTVFRGPKGHSLTNLAFEPSVIEPVTQTRSGHTLPQRFVVTDSSTSSVLSATLSD
jgi:gluconolactonase